MTTDRRADAGAPPRAAAADALGSADTVTVTGAADRPIVAELPPDSAFDAATDRFVEDGELGRGGMGRVADAFDRTLARRVAVKTMLAADRAAFARFEREARITAQLEHPAIVPLYEAGRHGDGTPYYVMRRVDGQPLDRAVHPAGFDQRLALVPNLLAVCDAAAFAHARAIVHRDIKPSNILLGRFGETLLIDWGLARRLDERDGEADGPGDGDGVTRAGAITGTPGFMSPEQARGTRIDARSDVYALGATLFYLLAGEPPHGRTTSAELIASVAAGEPPQWQRLPGGVPEDLRAIAAKALAADPAQRYRDAGALAADLRRFVTGNLVAAHRYTARERLRRFLRRHRVAVGVAAIAVALITTVVTVSVVQITGERDEANAARLRETARADELTLSHAWSLLDTNPTLAVALVRPLAGSTRWREVGDLLAAASARGVPWRLPGPAAIQQVRIAPDGERAVVVGRDAHAWLYDLRARAGRIAPELGRIDVEHGAHVVWRDDAHLAVFAGSALTIVDVHTGSRRAIPIAAPAIGFDVGGGSLWWADATHRLWRLDRDTPRGLDVGDEVNDFELSPDGQQLAVLGKTALWWIDASGEVRRLLDERAAAVAWDSTSADLLVCAYRSGGLRQVHLADPPVWGPDNIGRIFATRMQMSHGHFATQGLFGTWIDRTSVPGDHDARPAGLVMARDGIIAAGSTDGTIELLDRGARHHLIGPGRLDFIASRPGSRYLLAAASNDLLLWDLDAVLPRRIGDLDTAFTTWSAGPHHLLIPQGKSPSTWVDLQALTRRPGPVLDFAAAVVPSTSGARAVSTSGDITVMAVGAAQAETVARGARSARLVGDHRVVTVDQDGRVELRDLGTAAVTPLADADGRYVVADGEVFVVGYNDGNVERVDLATGRRDTLHAPLTALGVLGPDGRWWMTWNDQLVCWERDGRLVIYASAPGQIANLFVADAGHVVINTADAGFLIDTAWPGKLRRTIRLGSGTLFFGAVDGTVVAAAGYLSLPRVDRGATIVDGVTGVAWTVGQRGPFDPSLTPRLTPDGSVLYECQWRDKNIAVWPLPVARSPAEAVALAATLSNAVTNDTGDAVRWP